MDSLFFLIPVSIVLVIVVTLVFLWAVRSGQFDDLEGPAHSILHEEERQLDAGDQAVKNEPLSGEGVEGRKGSED